MHDDTSNTWLQEMQDVPDDTSGWRHLVESYRPFVRDQLVRHGVEATSAEDVSQQVLTIVWRKLPEFERQGTGSFRAWLRSITINCFRDFLKSRQYRSRAVGGTDMLDLAAKMEDPHGEFTHIWNRDHARHVVEELLTAVTPEFTAKSIEIFRRLAIDQESVGKVAADLGMTKNAVVVARSRVFRRLKSVAETHFFDEKQLFDS